MYHTSLYDDILCNIIALFSSNIFHKFRYYSGDDPEDAWDMRKALARDNKKQSVIPMDRPVLPQELEW